MGTMLNAVLSRKKIQLLNVTTEVQPESLHHLYKCERYGCDLEFSVSQKLEDQSVVCCPNCYREECIKELGDAAVMRGVFDNEF